MVAFDAAWKHELHTAGDEQGRSPTSFSLTPALIVAAGTAYTAGQITTATTDDGNFVANIVSNTAITTGRSSHLFRFDGVGTPTFLSFLSRFQHLIGLNETIHQQRLFIWNDTDSAWEQLASSTGTGAPRTFSGGPIANLSEYVNGSGEIFVLHWDWEGVFRTGGGCIHGDTLIALADGSRVAARDVKFGDQVFGRQDGVREPRKVDETTYHFPDTWSMVNVTAGRGLSYHVTEDHMCPVGASSSDEKRARDLTIGELIPDSQGNLWPILTIEKRELVCDVVDLDIRHDAYEVNGTGNVGLLVRTMPGN